MNIITQMVLSVFVLPFTILIFLPIIFISMIILLFIFNKKNIRNIITAYKEHGIFQPKSNNNELSNDTFTSFVFIKDKVFYYRYLGVISFLLIILIGSYDPMFYCSYGYSLILNVTLIVSIIVIFKFIRQVLLFYKIKISKIIGVIMSIVFIMLFSYYFSIIFAQNFHGWGDDAGGDACYNIRLSTKNAKAPVNTFKYDPNGPYPSPLVDKNIMINARGEVVDKWIKGTFKNIETNQVFDYSSKISSNYENTVDNCIKLNCKKIYFVDDTYITYGAGAYSNDTDKPAIGKVIKIDFYSKGVKVVSYPNPHDISDSAIYTILYSQNGKSGQTITYSEDLCINTKGGGQYCYEPHYKIGAVAIFLNKENKTSLTASNDSPNIFFTGKITEAELTSYQYSMSPDTGEVFPVVTR